MLAVVLSSLLVAIVLLTLAVTICRRKLKRKQNYKSKFFLFFCRKNTMIFLIIIFFKEKCLPNVMDDNSSRQSGNSPNLSVSEWVAKGVIHDSDQNSDKSSSSQKNLLSNDHSLNTNIAIIMGNDTNSISSKQYHSPIVPQYDRAHINSCSNYESHQNYMKSKIL